MQFHLLFFYLNKNNPNTNKENQPKAPLDHDLPFITIQLPLYNELYVSERLIDNIMQLQYPKNKLEIQVLDDSTDETIAICQKKVAEYQALGFDIKYVRRTNRKGYKAGALKEGMLTAKGEFIAIFDADFLPYPDFLLKTIAYFDDPKTGVVQTRWEHINKNYSLLTRLQAMQLDVHFTVEQKGRMLGNCLLQFNGTAGVWRRKTIEEAGGWEADTLTEDLDLSYRAQMKGWKIVFLEKFCSPAELPAEMNGLKSQQFRWTKGGAETARKILPVILKSNLSLKQKFHAATHLLSSGIFIFVFLTGITSVPLAFLIKQTHFNEHWLATFMLSLLSMVAVYFVANVNGNLERQPKLKLIFKFLILFPIFLAISMGLSLHNSIAVLQGYLGKTSPFVRTPKFNINSLRDKLQEQKYLATKINWITIGEGLLTLYFMAAFLAGFYYEATIFSIFHFLLFIGFGFISLNSVLDLKNARS